MSDLASRSQEKDTTARAYKPLGRKMLQSSELWAASHNTKKSSDMWIGSFCIKIHVAEEDGGASGRGPVGTTLQPAMAVHHVPADHFRARLVKTETWHMSILNVNCRQGRPRALTKSKEETLAFQQKDNMRTPMAHYRHKRLGCTASAGLKGATLKVSTEPLTHTHTKPLDGSKYYSTIRAQT